MARIGKPCHQKPGCCLPQLRPYDLNPHTLNEQFAGPLRCVLPVGTAEDWPATLHRPHAEHAGAIYKRGYHITVLGLFPVLTDDHLTGEQGHGAKGRVRNTDGEHAWAAADGE
jgi:hypothetical protein